MMKYIQSIPLVIMILLPILLTIILFGLDRNCMTPVQEAMYKRQMKSDACLEELFGGN